MNPGSLHVILDETRQSRHTHVELARLAAAGGADVIQYREKRRLQTAAWVATASAVREALREHPVHVIVNDRTDVALACGAHGVHLGRHDLDPATARRILGEQAIIGATANDLDEALRAAEQPVDYLGVGPVFGTTSKDDPARALGLDGLARIVAAVHLPVVAIGNITPERVASVLASGASGIAVLSAVACDPDPRHAASRFRSEIDRWMNATGGRHHARLGATAR